MHEEHGGKFSFIVKFSTPKWSLPDNVDKQKVKWVTIDAFGMSKSGEFWKTPEWKKKKSSFGIPGAEAFAFQARAFKQGKAVAPLLVKQGDNEKLVIIDGRHRFAAARSLGIAKIPVVFQKSFTIRSVSKKDSEISREEQRRVSAAWRVVSGS